MVEISKHREISVEKDAEPENDQQGDLPEEAMHHVPEKGVALSVADSVVKEGHVQGRKTQKEQADCT